MDASVARWRRAKWRAAAQARRLEALSWGEGKKVCVCMWTSSRLRCCFSTSPAARKQQKGLQRYDIPSHRAHPIPSHAHAHAHEKKGPHPRACPAWTLGGKSPTTWMQLGSQYCRLNGRPRPHSGQHIAPTHVGVTCGTAPDVPLFVCRGSDQADGVPMVPGV